MVAPRRPLGEHPGHRLRREPHWDVRRAGLDTNNHGQVDDGIVHDKNIWREGDWHFLSKVRKALGDRYVLTCDGENSENQRAAGVLSGIESEGPVLPNDGFRGISTTINTTSTGCKTAPAVTPFATLCSN